MRNKIGIVLLLPLFFGCHVNPPTANGPDTHEPQREYTKTITREASSEFEHQLIAQAEMVYPSRDSILAVAPVLLHSSIPDTAAWFCDIFQGIRIPYAITENAIEYYSHLIDSLAAHPAENRLITADFTYHATIGFHETYTFEGTGPYANESLPPANFDSVYVVHMSLKWDQNCGMGCGMYFSPRRLVIFDDTGMVLRVIYDGPAFIRVV